jgi:hypothetical protein
MARADDAVVVKTLDRVLFVLREWSFLKDRLENLVVVIDIQLIVWKNFLDQKIALAGHRKLMAKLKLDWRTIAYKYLLLTAEASI